MCVYAGCWDLQLDSTTKELWWQVPTQTLYVSITVILLACPNCTKPSSFRAPNQGQPGLAASNPIRSSTMITKPSDTGCQQTLSRQPYLPDPWLQSHRRGLVHFKLFPLLCLPLFPPFDFRRLVWFINQSVWMCVCLKPMLHIIPIICGFFFFFFFISPFHIAYSLCLLLLKPIATPPKSPPPSTLQMNSFMLHIT